MLTVRDEQLATLERAHLDALERRLVRSLVAEFPLAAKQLPGGVEAFVRQAIRAARTVWIQSGPQIEVFVQYLFRVQASGNSAALRDFTRIILTEQSATARLRMIEHCVLGNLSMR